MDERIKFFVGLDTHKDSICIGASEAGGDPARFVGTIGGSVAISLCCQPEPRRTTGRWR